MESDVASFTDVSKSLKRTAPENLNLNLHYILMLFHSLQFPLLHTRVAPSVTSSYVEASVRLPVY